MGKKYIKVVWLNGQQGLYEYLSAPSSNFPALNVIDATGHKGEIPIHGVMVIWDITAQEYEQWKAERPRQSKLITPM